MVKDKSNLLNEIASYYKGKLAVYGDTPKGVDWNGEEGQTIRFKQLCKVILHEERDFFTINDLGCGYGALLDYMKDYYHNFKYFGADICSQMIDTAKNRHLLNSSSEFINTEKLHHLTDYSLASGIFNVRHERTDEEWISYLHNTLNILHENCSHGFAFNCLTLYSEKEKKNDNLYYADPCQLFDFCKKNYSKQVALLHDYGLYEFTIIVRK